MANRSTNRSPSASAVTLLPGETIAAYERHRTAWFEEFPPDTDLETEFVERLCERSWLLKRCERLYHDAFTKTMLAHPDATTWSPEIHKQLQLLDRYRLSADRAYRAAWRDIETLRKNRVDAVIHVEKLKRLVYLNDRSGMRRLPDDPDDDHEEDTDVQEEQSSQIEPGALDPDELHHRDRHPG